MSKIRLPNNWVPRPYQRELWSYLENGGKRASEIAHRRWGKDEVALHFTATSAFEKVATYWHMLPEYEQARKAIWAAVNPHTGKRRIDEAFPMEIRANTNDQQMFIRFKNGSTWQVVGSDNYKKLVGSPPYGIVFSEWSKAKPGAWAFISPILEENDGWALFITTPEGENHAAKLHRMAQKDPKWFAQIQTVNETGFPLERVEAARREYIALYGQEAGEALIQQEYYCSFATALLGAVYGKAMEQLERAGRIKSSIYDPSLPVHTAWDLGRTDYTSIWFFQQTYSEVRLIDFFQMAGSDTPDQHLETSIQYFCRVLKERKYKYGKHYVPHDAAHKLLAANGRSIVQQAFDCGIKMTVIPATTQQNGITAAKKLLQQCWFDTKTEEGIESLRQYKYEFDEDRKMYKDKPLHNWASHAADAFEIIGQAWKNPVLESDKPKPKFLHDLTAKDVFWPEAQHQREKERI